jgi:transcriptional regulator with XRE-family HTH domain
LYYKKLWHILLTRFLPKRGGLTSLYTHRIKEIRQSQGLTLKQAAAVVGMNYANLSKIENDKRNVRMSTLERLAQGYGVTVADFFRDDIKEIR